MPSEEVTILKIVAFKAFSYNVMYKSIRSIIVLELISHLEGMMGVIEVAT